MMTGLAPDTSSISYQWTYDLFINFRGEDTRHGFTGNLYNALKKVGACTFLDDEELRRGDEITPTLLNAIENSRMAITIFSKNYASSTFCLNELVHIHECIKRKGRLVWPIFYDVDPSVVRHQKDNYEQSLSMHIKNQRADEDKIQSWKHALHEVANISGDHFNPRQGYEYQFIEKIVKKISCKINRVPLHVSEYPVGLESRVKKIISLLQIGSNDKVIMVGICGMGGLGKTTIARALYNSIADNFEGLCFLHDVKEKSKKLGLEKIQETILSNIVGVDIKIQDVNEGVQVMKKRFKEKKILLILDNIDKHEQLKKLAGDCYWFSAGSRIIITTRDEHLLVAHGVESRYNMEVFNAIESLELLSWNAFRNHHVDPCYKDVLKRAITYAQGLPLALEVIGSNLCGKTINEWESALDTYKLSLHKDIEQVLRVSYEDLEQVEKEIFLDIAFAFNGEELEYVKYMVEAVHDSNNLSYSIGVLVDKRLIKIEKYYHWIEMHDLIRDMGKKIVREESPNNPGERSRLWSHRDIVDVLEGNTGTNKVRMIVQDNWSKCIEVNWDGEAFKSMKVLKILFFENVKFSEDPKYLPENLKVLKWRRYPSSSLPRNIIPKKLLVLDIGYSYLSSLETITKTSNNLGILNLGGCDYIKEIPDLSNLRNLKELILLNCKNLIAIHDSVGYLPKLEVLDVFQCIKLKTFPCAIKLPSLRELNLDDCRSLEYFPEILGNGKITVFHLSETGIRKLPWSICNLSEISLLHIVQGNHFSNRHVIEIPNSIFLLPKIEKIIVTNTGKVKISCNYMEAQEEAIWSQQCPNRVEFLLPRCNISDDVLRTCLSRFMNARYLNLEGNDFTVLPSWIKKCHFLENLNLNDCKHLREVKGIPPHIRSLEARNCMSLSLESKSLILREELHGDPDRYPVYREVFFCVPSESIPKWFDHRSKGASISFWFRHSFPPALCLCLLLKLTDSFVYTKHSSVSVSASVYINDERVDDKHDLWRQHWNWHDLKHHHLVVYNLKRDYKIEGLGGNNKWNHVQVRAHTSRPDAAKVVEESGIYVIKQLCKMEHITFQNPYQTLDSSCAVQEQLDRRMKEKEGALDENQRLMADDNFVSSSTSVICTKRGRNISINEDDNDAITPQIINSQEQVGTRMKEEEVEVNKNRRLMGDDNLASDDNDTTPQVPFIKACEIINNNLRTLWAHLVRCIGFDGYGDDESANHQERQQQKDVTSTNVEQVPKSFEDNRKAKGKEIVIYDDTINE